MVAFNTAAPAVARIPAEVETHPAVAGRIGLRLAGYDRRIHPRREVSLRVSGRRLDHSAEARREPALNLNLHDVSLGGLRATSQSRLAVGERVAVYFPPTPAAARRTAGTPSAASSAATARPWAGPAAPSPSSSTRSPRREGKRGEGKGSKVPG